MSHPVGLPASRKIRGARLFAVAAHGAWKRLVTYAEEMATIKPEVVVTMCTPSTRAMSTASTSIPIVMGMISDPVGQPPERWNR